MPAGFSAINGDIFSWNSCQFFADLYRIKGCTALTFADKIENEYVQADNQDGTPIGMTYGNYTPDDVKLRILRSYKKAFELYVSSTSLVPGSSLGGGRFVLTCKIYEPSITGIAGADVSVLELCRITGIDDTAEQGTGALVTEYTIRTMKIFRNGIPLFDPARNLL